MNAAQKEFSWSLGSHQGNCSKSCDKVQKLVQLKILERCFCHRNRPSKNG